MFTRSHSNVRKVVLSVAGSLLLGIGSTAMAGSDGSAPQISQPVNVSNKPGPVMPTIKLPDGWANPTTGGSGGYVAPPVDVSSGTIRGTEVNTSSSTVNTSSGTARGSSGGSSKPAPKKTK